MAARDTTPLTTQKRENEIDEMLDESFPASDPPSTTPLSSTRESSAMKAAHAHDDDEAKGMPHSERQQTETAAARTHGVHPAETDDRAHEKT